MKSRFPIVCPVVLFVLMFLPFGLGISLLTSVLYEGWREFKREVLEIGKASPGQALRYAFLADGTPLVSNIKMVGQKRIAEQSHLNGTPLTLEEGRSLVLALPLYVSPRWSQNTAFAHLPFSELIASLPPPWSIQEPANSDVFWEWEVVPEIPARRLLVARDNSSGQPISYVSREGFGTAVPEPAEAFSAPSEIEAVGALVAFRSDNDLMSIDLEKKSVTTIAQLDTGWPAWNMCDDLKESGWRFIVRGSREISVYSDDGTKLLGFGKLETQSGNPQVFITTDDRLIVVHSEPAPGEQFRTGSGKSSEIRVASWLDETGNVTRTMNFEAGQKVEVSESPSAVVRSIDQLSDTVSPTLFLPGPVFVSSVMLSAVPQDAAHAIPDRTLIEWINQALAVFPNQIAFSFVVALWCAIACWRRQKRYQAANTAVWVVLVFCSGIPGWLAWRVLRRWPPVDIIRVAEFGFVGPEADGLEIR